MTGKAILDFTAAINSHDVEKIATCITDDHAFTDAHGNEIIGKNQVKAGWKAYFEWFPDYRIELNEIFENGNVTAAFGFAEGTYQGMKNKAGNNSWRLPAAWKAAVMENKISRWQVYADTKIPFDSMTKENRQVINDKHESRVTSIGGIFFKCKDPDRAKEWYKKHLGLDTDQYGTNFEWRHGADGSRKGFTQWSPFKDNTTYFEPSTRDFMINYRVKNLQALVDSLKKEGVTVTDSIETFEYGKFVHIMDEEGNKIELWEPDDVEYDKIVTGRTK